MSSNGATTMGLKKGKTYWANIPWDGPKSARGSGDYIGSVTVNDFGVSGKKVFVVIPVDHFFYEVAEPTRYVCVTVDCLGDLI